MASPKDTSMTITRPRKQTGKKRTNRPQYQLLPDLPPEEFASLKADIEENGLQYPVIQDEQGNTLDGHQRERALAELGIKNYPVKVIAGMTEEEKRHYTLALDQEGQAHSALPTG
jgi:ParB-like chromosome segregation protein Spo0J